MKSSRMLLRFEPGGSGVVPAGQAIGAEDCCDRAK